MKPASFGSVSTGTMRDDGLLDALADELHYQLSRQPRRYPRSEPRKLIRDARKALAELTSDAGWSRDYEPGEIVSELLTALEEFAPAYAYFGARPGDGADYGYWLLDDLGSAFDGLRVDDTAEVPRDYRGEVLHYTDHGNMTLYVAHGRKGRAPKLREIWAVV